jgi:nucleoside transporter
MLNDGEREFPLIRVFGTLGWIVAGILVSFVWNGDTTGLPMRVAGGVGVLMGLYCFTLPNVPPPAPGTRLTFKDIIGLDALSRLNSRPVIVLLVSVLLTSIPLATYYSYVPVFLRAAQISNPAFKMTFGNMSEAIFLLLLPWFFRRMGLKWVLIIGMSAWILRYALFAFGAPDAVTWVIMLGILLHGACYDFVYVAGQVYMDRVAPPAIRAQAQGLFVLVSYGIGHGLGALAAGRIYNQIVTGEGRLALEQWKTFWLIPLVFATFVTILFVLGSKTEKEVSVPNESAPIAS